MAMYGCNGAEKSKRTYIENTSERKVYYDVIGNLVIIQISLMGGEIVGDRTLFTMPEGLRPITTIACPNYIGTGEDNKRCFCAVGSNGKVRLLAEVDVYMFVTLIYTIQ